MRQLLTSIFLASILSSCTESDTTDPIIEILSSSPSATQGLVCGEMEENVITINSTDTLEIVFRVSDDQELSQYKIDIHNNFDCHGHSGKTETTDWYLISIEDVGGSDETITRQLPVPTDVTSGNYHFHILATDAVGNNAEPIIYSINVTNSSDTEAPVLEVTTPQSHTFSVLKGDAINFQGTITDNQDLGTASNGRIELRYWNTGNLTINDLYTQTFDNSAGTSVNFDFDAIVPPTTTDGTYIFELRSFDAVNNPSNTVQFTVEVD